jgi:hypothetical protein
MSLATEVIVSLCPTFLLGDNIDTIKKNTESVIEASKEVGLEVNT